MKKILSNLFTLLIMLSLAAAPALANYELEQGPSSYPDLPKNHWAYEAVTFLTDKKVVVGYPDGYYRPDQKVTRGEFSTMVIKALGLYEKETPQIFQYKDTEKHWAHRNIQVASYYGLLTGYPGGWFRPNNDVTRIEALTIVMNALSPENINTDQAKHFVNMYKDYSDIPDWALIQAGQAQMLGLVYNTPGHETTLEPNRPATRGELAKLLFGMVEAAKKIPSDKIKDDIDIEPEPAVKKPAEPKKADGYILDNVYYDEEYAVIPEGTVLPLTVDKCLNARVVKEGETFVARTPFNFVTREKYIVLPVGVQIAGKVHKVQRPTRFIKNGYFWLTTSNVLDDKGNPDMKLVAGLGERKADMRIIRNDPYLTRTRYNVIKGQNEYIHKGQRVMFTLLEPLRVKIFNRDDI
ncbi:MAG: S-layer homology domain-containing protein [Candidatus Gastranaerophilales bacterium]|nr:S-layer homology domain-containing protein [Candidatus Gastranaerophilales bacterium]